MLSCSLSVGMTISVSRAMLAGSRAFPAPGAGARWRRGFTSYHRLRLPGKAQLPKQRRKTSRGDRSRARSGDHGPSAGSPGRCRCDQAAPVLDIALTLRYLLGAPGGERHGKAGDPRLCRARLPGSAAAHHRRFRGGAPAEPRGAAGITHGRGDRAAPAQPRVRAVRGELGWGAWMLTLLPVLLAAASAAVEPAQAPEQINARDAGARADGVHDDAPALQAALDRLADRGGVLDLPAGTYLVGAPLVMRGDNVVLRGDGATLRAGKGFAAGAGAPAALVRGGASRGGSHAPALHLSVVGLGLDGAGISTAGLWIERARDVTVRGTHVRRVRAGGGGAIVVRSADDRESDTGEVTVADNVVELDETTTGSALRHVANCRVSGNRVQGTGGEGGHGLDLTLSRRCTVSDTIVLTADIGCLTDETNHLQIIGNYVYGARTGF